MESEDINYGWMNYQMLLECYAKGMPISKTEAELLDIELYSQLESIKISKSEGCTDIAPDHICHSSKVCKGSYWITCLAAVLDRLIPKAFGTKARGAIVFDELTKNKYLTIY